MTFTFDPTVPGHVYLIQQGDLVKIGWSGSPGQRLVQVADPSRAKIIHLIPSADPPRIECALHRRFADVRVQGEWFRLSEEDIALVCTAGRADTVDDLPKDLIPEGGVPPRQKRTGVPLHVWLPPALRDALSLAAKKNRRSITAEFSIAMEERLRSEGLWPPVAP